MPSKYIPRRIWSKAQALLGELQTQHWSQLGGKQLKAQLPNVVSFRLSRDYRMLWYPDGRYRVLSHAAYNRALALGRVS